MQHLSIKPASGHVYRVARKRGAVWYCKYRLPEGRQVQKRLGPAWTSRGRPAEGYFTKTKAEAELRRILSKADAGTLPGQVKTGVTLTTAADEWLRYVEHERRIKASTLVNYKLCVHRQLLPALGAETPVEDVTTVMIERWRAGMMKGRSARTVNHAVVIAHGLFKRAQKVYGLPSNPVASVERIREKLSGDLNFYAADEVRALVRAAGSELDGTAFLTLAFTGIRLGELVALRVGDVEFDAETIRVRASYSYGALTLPKSGRVRSVPMVPEVAAAIARLLQREHFTGRDDLVFPGLAGGYLDGSALRRRYKEAIARAGLRKLRLHDLRHVFGSLAIGKASLIDVQQWMGHANIQTTMIYLHFKPKKDEARLLAEAFTVEPLPEPEGVRPAA